MKIDVVLTPAEIADLPRRDLASSICVVFDVLRATSTMITALAHGAREIFPVRTVDEAFALKNAMPGALLAGERGGGQIDGFGAGNSPLEFRGDVPARIVTTTTNGTIALRACDHAGIVLIGSLLNMGALGEHLRSLNRDAVMVCAGTGREAAWEDIIAAGMLSADFPSAMLGDAARVAISAFEKARGDLHGALCESRNGRALLAQGRDAEIHWCAQVSRFDMLGMLDRGVIRKLES